MILDQFKNSPVHIFTLYLPEILLILLFLLHVGLYRVVSFSEVFFNKIYAFSYFLH